MKRLAGWVGFLMGIIFCLGQVPFAYGFAYRLPTQSTVGLSKGNAVLTDLEEPSSVYYNPAATAYSSGLQMTAGSQFMTYQTDHSYKPLHVDESSYRQNIFLPNFYATYNLKDFKLEPVTLGFGVASPFGLQVHYRNGSPITPIVQRAELTTMDYLMTMGLKLNDKLSLGAGLDIMHSDVLLTNRIPFGLLVGAGRSLDARTRFSSGDTSVGFNNSLLWKITKNDSFAFKFRSQEFAHYDGKVKVRSIPSFTGLPAGLNGSAKARVNFPAVFTGAYSHQFGKLKLEFDLDWTKWDNVNSLVIHSTGNPLISDLRFPASFHNAFTYDLGATYELCKWLDLYGGFIWTNTPVTEANFTAVIPDSDRFALSCGLGTKVNKSLKIDTGFQWVHFLDRDIKNSVGFPVTTVNGGYETEAFIVGVNATCKF